MSERRAARAAQTREHGILYYIGVGLSWGVLAFVSLIAALVVVVPAVTGSTPYTILTSSMEPGLPPGTLVVVRPTDPADIRIGSIVTYQLESGKPAVVTHRVIAILQPNLPDGEVSFTTKGDANGAADPDPVTLVQVRGTVWYSVPLIGWVNNVVNGDMRAVIIPIVAGLLLIYGGYLIVSNAIEKRRARRTQQDAAAEGELASSRDQSA